jgi:ACDE family multidrug resistance protein
LFVAAPFTFGPWLGVWMFENIDPAVTYGVVGICALAMLVFFWFLRVSDNPAVTSPLKPPPNPIRYMPRFFRQPRLAVAWGLAIGRTSWWLMFFVYGPIFLTQSGYSKDTAALIISVGVLPMFLATVWGAIGRKKGIRYLLTLGYGLTAIISIGIAVVQGVPAMAAVLIVVAAFAASMIDGAGNIPFLRAVHPYERSEMTSVYVTFRQTAQLITPGILAVVLSTFALPAVFVAGGIGAGAMAVLARFVPKRL